MTSREFYNKIRWDKRIDSSKVNVGVEDRFRGVLEMPFADQRLGADVPWHRIVHFHYDGQLVWDRRGTERPDLLVSDTRTEKADCFRWDTHKRCWSACQKKEKKLWNKQLKVLSWNVLFDLYDRNVPRSKRRFPGLLRCLESCDADIVCLQEVTPEVAEWLLQDSWIRSCYFSSTAHPETELTPYGPLLFSKFAVQVEHRSLQAGKSVVQAVFETQTGPAYLVNLHLFSDRTSGAESLREAQLQEVLAYLEPAATCWLVGDFNQRGSFDLEGFTDTWELLEAESPGFTYDPVTNGLARLTTTTNRVARFDRILHRGGWTPLKTTVVRETNPTSDHYPILTEFVAPCWEGPVHRTALVVIPPTELWDGVQSIRREHDKSFDRWMPHINLLYGFVSEEHFGQAAEILKTWLATRPAFEVRLREYNRFEHKQSTTIWLKPECTPKNSLRELQRKLEVLFPECRQQSSHSPHGFTPHLTVASVPKGRALPSLPPLDLSFTVDSVALIARGSETPFKVQQVIELEERELSKCLPPKQNRQHLVSEAMEFCQRQGCRGFVVGSEALELDLPWSDLDLLVVGHQSDEEFFATLPAGRAVPGRVVLWRTTIEGCKVDFQYAQYSNTTALKAPDEALWAELGGKSAAALRSFLELQALLAAQPLPKYRELLRRVRYWTHQRCIDTPAFGYPGGWAWAVLVLRFLKTAHRSQDLISFFNWFAGLRKESPWEILSLVDPPVNLAPNLTTTTIDILQQEADRGCAMAQHRRWKALFQEFEPENILRLEVAAEEQHFQGQYEGWLNSRLVKLILEIERSGQGRLHPYRLSYGENSLKLSFACLGNPAESVLRDFCREFQKNFPRTSISTSRQFGVSAD